MQRIIAWFLLFFIAAEPGYAGITFDAVDDSATTAGAASTMLTASAGTLVAWIRPNTSTPGGSPPCHNLENIVGDHDAYVRLGRSSATQLCSEVFDTSAHEHQEPFTAGALTHWALTWNGTTMLTYKDGVQVNSQSAGTVGDLTTAIIVGGAADYGPSAFDGTIEAVELFSSVLAPDEIAAKAGARQFSTGRTQPTARWDFRQCTGGASADGVAMLDLSGNGRSLTVDNGANNTGTTCTANVLTFRPGLH